MNGFTGYGREIEAVFRRKLVPLVERNQRLYSILKFVYRSVSKKKTSDPGPIHKLVDALSRTRKNIFFLQIGSNDGVTGDPIHFFVTRDKWAGILVEPVGYVFDRLVENYRGHDNLIFENLAVSDKKEKKDFWYLKNTEDELPIHYDQIGSFFRPLVMKHRKSIPNIEKFIVKKQIDCLPLSEIIGKHNVRKVDLIHIDTEGYDCEVIKQIDFDRFDPVILIFEHKHLREDDLKACICNLYAKGYSLIREAGNTIAFKASLLENFTLKISR